ncbi:hypothetical protein [Deinococcus hohokamensis]|uniref:Uncharacterized protein n=1 Tax=Deinococcus hohokamensis TaxID=309883 RepID=A0ABV9IBP2_9DEIO
MHLRVTAPDEFAWVEAPAGSLRPGEARIETLLSAVSVASELSVVRDGPLPARLGYQTLGRMVQTQATPGLLPGQRVVCTLGHAASGVCRADHLIPVPDDVPDRPALCVILGEETHKGTRKVAPAAGEPTPVAGAGLLGLLSVFNLTRRGVTQLSVREPDPARRALARRLGAAAYTPGELPHDAFAVGLE